MFMFRCFRPVQLSSKNSNTKFEKSVSVKPQNVSKFQFSNGTEGHIYVIKEREFLKTGENIFKIGKTKNIVNRMPQYPKNSRIYIMFYSLNIDDMEKHIIKHFDNTFTKRTDIGSEYYECEGNALLKEMIVFMDHVYSHQTY